MNKVFIFVAMSLLMAQTTLAAEYKLLIPAQILDVEQGAMIKDQQVLIKGNKIVAIGSELDLPDDVEVIKLDGLTLMPGLIDAHSHILLDPYNETSWNDQVLLETRVERVARSVNHLKATIEAGFTSLRDLGSEGAGYADVGLKRALEKGIIVGPRLIVAGRAIVATGSYGPKGFDLSHDLNLGAEPADGDDLIRVTRNQIGKGADVVKVYADYGWGQH